ncbi:retrovirus-related pol polyprotein from transposon TNT 1-94 [Tanacetum coccineum]
MTTLADKSLLSGGDNKPPMLEKHLYDSWKSRMELYMMNIPHGRMILASIEKGPLIWPSITVDRVAKDLWEKIKLLMQGTSLTKQEREFNTKFLNTLPDEWSKFVTDVKLVKDLHTTNVDQLHAHLEQHERHANEVRLMQWNETPILLALDASSHITQSPYQTHQHTYQNTQLQPPALTYPSPQYGSPYQSQQYSTHQSSTPLSVTYPSNDFQSSIHHNIYSPSSSIPQLEYPPQINQQSEFSQQDSGLIVPVFQKGDDPIDAINHMMSFLTAVVTSRYPTTIISLINSSNPYHNYINKGKCYNTTIQGDKLLLLRVLQGLTLQEQVEAILENRGRFFAITAKGKATCPDSAPNQENRDDPETLALAEESLSKMLSKHKDNMMLEKEKQVDTTPIDYNSVNSLEPTLSVRPTNIEVPKELPKVSMVNTSLKKLKYHLANFDVVVNERTTPTAITEVKMNQVLNENERLLEQVMSKDIVNLLVNPSVENDSVNVHECQECLKLETELQTDFVKKETYDKLFKSFTILEKHCISLEVDTQLKQEIFQRENSVSNQSVPSFDQLFELNELKAQSQEKDNGRPNYPLAESVATACYTQNRSMIRLRHGKIPYELLHNKPPDLSYLYVFGALCYPTNDCDNLGKLQPNTDIGIFIGYAPTKKAFRIYNRRTRQIIETIHIDFDELIAMASEHNSSGPALHEMTPATISSRLLFDELFNPPPSVDFLAPEVIAPIDEVVAPEPAASTSTPSSTTVDQDAPSPSNSQSTPETPLLVIPNDVEEDNHDIEVAHMGNDPYFGVPILEIPSDQSSSSDSIHIIVHPDH